VADEPADSDRTNYTPVCPNHIPPGVADTRQNRKGRFMPASTNFAVAGPARATVRVQRPAVRT
jgi:hypothetical protein